MLHLRRARLQCCGFASRIIGAALRVQLSNGHSSLGGSGGDTLAPSPHRRLDILLGKCSTLVCLAV